MVFAGLIQNGAVVLSTPVALPDGTEVRVESLPLPSEPERATMLDLLEFAGIVTDWPDDMAENHDHYIHGAPKR